MKILRWIAVFPAGLAAAIMVMFPIHWLIMIKVAVGTADGNPVFLGLSAETVEQLAIAFSTPFTMIYVGAWTAPTRRVEAGVTLAIIMALILGGVYVLAFTGGPRFGGWSSLHFGATPVLNLLGIVAALFAIRSRYRLHESSH